MQSLASPAAAAKTCTPSVTVTVPDASGSPHTDEVGRGVAFGVGVLPVAVGPLGSRTVSVTVPLASLEICVFGSVAVIVATPRPTAWT